MRPLSRVLGMLAVSGLAMFLPGLAVQVPAAPPPYTLEERAEAIARPALVFLEARSTGFVRNKTTGEAYSPDPIVIYQRCSGFVVNPDGHVVTARHCAQPTANGWRDNAFAELADRMIAAKTLTADQRSAFMADLSANGAYTGQSANSEPQIVINGQQNALRVGEAVIPGQVVSALPLNAENIALVKLAVGGLPAVELGATASIDEQLTLLGYGAVTGAGGDRTFVPRSRTARVTALPAQPSSPSKLDSDLGVYSHGGMAVDGAGKAVGLINIDRDVKDLPRRAMVSVATLKGLLDKAGVKNTLGPADVSYRAGLDAYFGGRYAEAIKHFDEVLSVVPDHQLAAGYRRQAADRQAIEAEPRQETTVIPMAISALAGAVVATVVILTWQAVMRRRRFARLGPNHDFLGGPYAPISAVPVSAYPVSGGGQYQGYETTGYGQQPVVPGPTQLSLDPPDGRDPDGQLGSQ